MRIGHFPLCFAADLRDSEVVSRQLSEAGVKDPQLADIEKMICLVDDGEVDTIRGDRPTIGVVDKVNWEHGNVFSFV